MTDRRLAAAHIFVAVCFVTIFFIRLAYGQTDGFWNLLMLGFHLLGAITFTALAAQKWERRNA